MHVSRFGSQLKGRARENFCLGFTHFSQQSQSARRQICQALTPKVSYLPPNPPKPPKTGGRGDGNSQPSNGSSIDKEAFHNLEPHETQHILILDISGMHCGGCASKVKRVLEQHELVTQANVNLATEVARVAFILPPKFSDNAQNISFSHEEVVHQLLGILKKNGFEGKVRDTSKGNSAVAKVVESRQKERSSTDG